MRRHALAMLEYLDRTPGDARPQLLAQQRVGHGVVMLVDLDVIVEADPALLPCGILVWFGRQGFEGRTVKLVKQGPPACAEMTRHAAIELDLMMVGKRDLKLKIKQHTLSASFVDVGV